MALARLAGRGPLRFQLSMSLSLPPGPLSLSLADLLLLGRLQSLRPQLDLCRHRSGIDWVDRCGVK